MSSPIIPMQYLCKSFATLFMDELVRQPNYDGCLSIIALGAVTYSDLKIGGEVAHPEDFRDFLRLRIYKVDYQNFYPVGMSAVLTAIGKGTVSEAEGLCENPGILDIHWLG